MTDLDQGTVSSVLLSRFTYNAAPSCTHASFLGAFIEHLQYASLCGRPSWSRVNQTVPEAPFTSPSGLTFPQLPPDLVHSFALCHFR